MSESSRRWVLIIVLGIVMMAVATCGGLMVVGDALNTLFSQPGIAPAA